MYVVAFIDVDIVNITGEKRVGLDKRRLHRTRLAESKCNLIYYALDELLSRVR